MKPGNLFDAVLWDMDGVIVDTYHGHLVAWKQALAEAGVDFTEETFLQTFGMNNRLILTHVFGREPSETRLSQISNRKEELFRRDMKNTVKVLPGVIDWLGKFKTWNVRQAVASSAPQANIDAILGEFSLREYFDADVAGEKMRGKPYPDIFLLAAERLGANPAECLVIEDSVAGVEAAKKAGCACLAVLTTNQGEALAGADLVIEDLTRLSEQELLDLHP